MNSIVVPIHWVRWAGWFFRDLASLAFPAVADLILGDPLQFAFYSDRLCGARYIIRCMFLACWFDANRFVSSIIGSPVFCSMCFILPRSIEACSEIPSCFALRRCLINASESFQVWFGPSFHYAVYPRFYSQTIDLFELSVLRSEYCPRWGSVIVMVMIKFVFIGKLSVVSR